MKGLSVQNKGGTHAELLESARFLRAQCERKHAAVELSRFRKRLLFNDEAHVTVSDKRQLLQMSCFA